MRNIAVFSIILALAVIFNGCSKDNYDPPKSFLKGNVVYNGTPVGVRSNGTQLELWQYGYQLRSKIAVYIAQDGSYSAKVFDGDYKLVRLKGGPWEDQTDTINVTVSGLTQVDVPVTPYFTISGATISVSGGVLTSSCTVTKTGTKNIQSLTLYAGITNIVDANNNSQTNTTSASGLADLSTPKTNTITLSTANAARDFIYARIGVQISGVGERFYTPVQKISLK